MWTSSAAGSGASTCSSAVSGASTVSTRDEEGPGGCESGVFIAEEVHCRIKSSCRERIVIVSSLCEVPFETKDIVVS